MYTDCLILPGLVFLWCGLFNDALSDVDCMASNVRMTEMLESDLERNLWPKQGAIPTFIWMEF